MNKLLVVLFIFGAFISNFLLNGNEPDMQTFLNQYYSSSKKKECYTKLIFAMENGHRSIALKLLANGEDPNQTCSNVYTPLMFAIAQNDVELVQTLICKDANVNLGSNQLYPLFLNVITNTDTKITKILCDSGANVKTVDRSWGIWMLNHPLAQTLLSADHAKFELIANILIDDELKWIDYHQKNIFATPILWFTKPAEGVENSIKIADYLLQRGVAIETTFGGSGLANAARTGNLHLMNFLIGADAKIDFLPYKWQDIDTIPIIAAIQYWSNWSHLQDIQDLDKKCIPAKCEPLQLLLDNNAKINFSFPPSWNQISNSKEYLYSPLGYAAEFHVNEAIELLIAYGADVNIMENSGKTPLMRAVSANNFEGVILLLNAEADPTKRGTFDRRTPIEIAYDLRYIDILNVLIEAEARMY